MLLSIILREGTILEGLLIKLQKRYKRLKGWFDTFHSKVGYGLLVSQNEISFGFKNA